LRAAACVAVAVAFALAASGVAPAQGQPTPPRLQGTFALRGRLTTVDHVYGEHQGQRVRRTWTFVPQCAAGGCRRVILTRRRSGRHIVNLTVLKRRGPSLYVGRDRFWVALGCSGRVVKHGGLATATITVRITHSAIVGTTRFATAIKATYNNPRRTNLTRCPGGIGHDAASYRGRLASPLPGLPSGGFTATPNLATISATFTDQSTPSGDGAPIVAWAWNFGDPSSPADTSTVRDPTHQFSAPGNYTVTLAVTDGYGQTSITTGQVTV
jgi:PKD domain-containing protein